MSDDFTKDNVIVEQAHTWEALDEQCRELNGDGPWFIHPINPHESHEHHDVYLDKVDKRYFRGTLFGIWAHREKPISPWHYEFCSQNIDAAIHTKKQLDQVFSSGKLK